MTGQSLEELSRNELIVFAARLIEEVNSLKEIMIDKPEVAKRAGMSVSWLDNSHCEKAQRLRGSGVRYGTSQTSAIRYPLSDVLRICKQDELRLSSKFAHAACRGGRPTIASSPAVHPNRERDCN